MIKIQFTNAQVDDMGYGLYVNGKKLEEIISTALGTRVDKHYGNNAGLPSFGSNCCDVTVIIDPKPVTTLIDTEAGSWERVEDMEEILREQYEAKAGEAKS